MSEDADGLSKKQQRRRSQRNRIQERQNSRCCICGVRFQGSPPEPNAFTIEHIYPRSRGGPDAMTNYLGTCCRCNSMRGVESLFVLFDFIKRQAQQLAKADLGHKWTQRKMRPPWWKYAVAARDLLLIDEDEPSP